MRADLEPLRRHLLSTRGGGRPFVVNGRPRRAEVFDAAGWCPEAPQTDAPSDEQRCAAELWRHAGVANHASVASFARFTLQLLALGAPAEMVTRATQATTDVVRHAESCFAIAGYLDGEVTGPGPLDTRDAYTGQESLYEVVLGAVEEGCFAETLAAAEARAASDATTDPWIAEILWGIAEDESRHAALAWRFVHWAIELDPSLAVPVRARLARPKVGSLASPTIEDLSRFGILPVATRQALHEEVWTRVILPCVDRLPLPDVPRQARV